MQSLQGKLLVASPYLPDGNFAETVILMVYHNEEGAMGLVLNRPSDCTVGEAWNMALSDDSCECPQMIDLGGPCQGPLMAIHNFRSYSEQTIAKGIYFSSEKGNLRDIVGRHDRPFRIFSGYSGWSAGQLEREMEEGSWLVAPATKESVFSTNDELWREVADYVGREILINALGIHHTPEDPSWN